MFCSQFGTDLVWIPWIILTLFYQIRTYILFPYIILYDFMFLLFTVWYD